MLNWIKSWFKKKKKPEVVSVPFSLPNGKKFIVEAISIEENVFQNNREKFKCQKHPDYNGNYAPKENCNDCWEFHYKVSHHII